MDALKQKILNEGQVLPGNVLKVDHFLNHQIDPELMYQIGQAFAGFFAGRNINRILTIEASGIPPALMAGLAMKLPVVFAKKTEAANLDTDFLAASVYSFTRQREYTIRVSRKYLQPRDRVLVIDDFLANGQALLGLADIISQAGADFVGAGIVIEKAFQQGGELARERGIEVHSLAKIQDMTDGKVHFCDDHL